MNEPSRRKAPPEKAMPVTMSAGSAIAMGFYLGIGMSLWGIVVFGIVMVILTAAGG